MAFPASSGYPQNSGTLIPEVWSTNLIATYYAQTCLGSITSREYEGEIKDQGDVVHIRTTPRPKIYSNYVKGQSLETDIPQAQIVDLLIDRGDYMQFLVEDIDKVQSDIDYQMESSAAAAEDFQIAIDSQAFGLIYPDAHAKNKGATAGAKSSRYNLGAAGAPLAIDKTNATDVLVDVNAVLTEQNAPRKGRWVVLPGWYENLLLKSELKQAYLTGDATSVVRNGLIGRVSDLDIYISNLLPEATDGGHYCNHIIAGCQSSIAFAAQFTKTETLKTERTFGTLVRGLQVWGIKTIKPEGLVDIFAYGA